MEFTIYIYIYIYIYDKYILLILNNNWIKVYLLL